MFFVKRKAFKYSVEVVNGEISIKPAHGTIAFSNWLSPNLFRSLKVIASYVTDGLDSEDKEEALMDYFSYKGYQVIAVRPMLTVDNGGEMRSWP